MFQFTPPKSRILLALTVLAGMAATPALAAINSVTGSPGSASVSQSTATLVNITWSVQVIIPAPGPVGTELVQSTSATIRAGGTTVQTINTPFAQVVTGPPGRVETPTFNETISVSPSIATAIANAGGGTITRQFSGASNSVTGQITLSSASGSSITTPGTSNSTTTPTVAISALELSFEDGSRYATVAEGQRLRARADIVQSGRGTVLGTWEIADLSTASDDLPPRFRPIERVQRIVTGNQKITIFSPPLPTSRQAPYIVRFNVEQPTGITAPQLRYTVIAGTVPERIRIISPPEGAPVGSDTRFQWAPEPGAAAYRVEFGPAPAPGERRRPGDIIAAIDMQADSTSATALPFTLETLAQTPRIEWRVVALDANGLPIAVSPFRRIGLGDIGSR